MTEKTPEHTGDTPLSPEQLKELLPDERHRENFLRLIGRLEADDSALVVLKGHLVIEERLDAIIEKFVFHPEHLEKARLTFAQKLSLARCLSLDEDRNTMWNLIEKLNALRNKLSHSLDGEQRVKAMEGLKTAFRAEMPRKTEEGDETVLLASVLALCLGFLGGFEMEVERFKEYVAIMDRAVNPHRH